MAASISLTGFGTAYTQDFDTLSNVAGSTTNVLSIAGWALTEAGGGARDNEQYAVDTGSSTTGDTYSYGAAGSTDRALGALRSGTLISTFGAFFTNTTGGTITSLDISYVGEEWRLGTAGRADRLDFQYNASATDLTAGTWTDANALDFSSPDTATVGAKNGNATADRTPLSSTITGLSIAPNATFGLRWLDSDASGADDGLAIDDFSLTARGAAGGAGTVSIANASISEGDAGTKTLTFTVTRSDTTSAFTVNYATADGAATVANADYVATSGALTFAAGGAASQTVSVTINGDATVEPDETFSVTLSGVVDTTGTTNLGMAMATGTILNDDVTLTPIYTIQGSGQTSGLTGQTVTTRGVVIAVDSNGFYIQDAVGDGNAATSDGIFVFTSVAPTVAVGNLVTVSGQVQEFTPSGSVAGTLSVTEIANTPVVTVVSPVNALPAATLIGGTGLTPATADLAAGNTFFEALEGMRVTLVAPQATGPTNSFGEIFTVVDNGAGATGINGRGDILISGGAASFGNTDTAGGDFNPERIQIDRGLGQTTPQVSVGARLADVTGIVNYSFGNYEVLATSAVTVTAASPLVKTGATLRGDANHILIASYNAENLDPGDGQARFTTVGGEIVNRLNAPDILALQEVQDNNGATGGTGSAVTSASQTLQMIVDAVTAAGGPQYSFIDNTFIGANTNGGEPGGNIRTAYLYRTDHVSLVPGSARTIGADGGVIMDQGSAAANAAANSDQQTNAQNPFFGSRPPLAADFLFNGQVVTVVNDHFTSKGGSGVLAGSIQPPVDAGEVARAAQAQAVNTFVDGLLGANPNARVIVTGDLNEYGFEQPLSVLRGTATISGYTGGGANGSTTVYTPGGTEILSDLQDLLPADQRFDYVFEGNAQTLDHMLISASLAAGAQFEPVHINSEFFDQTSDHDPLVGRFSIPAVDTTAPTLALTSVSGAANAVAHVVSGTIGVADAGRLVTIRDGSAVLGSAQSDAEGRFSLPFVFEGDGVTKSYALTATATDAAGNTGSSDNFVFNLDFMPNKSLFGAVTNDGQSPGGLAYALYDGLLGRAPDADGFVVWADELSAGASLRDVALNFLASDEHTSRFGSYTQGSDDAFVQQLYATALGRGSDAQEVAYWHSVLASGASRVDVALGFALSDENRAQIAPALRTGVFVSDEGHADIARLYYGLLERAPDAGGLQAFENAAKSGASLKSAAQALLDSGEYMALHTAPLSDAQYVAGLYENALGRTPDATGAQVWSDALAGGTSRADVALSIVEGPEAQAHLRGQIEAGWHLS